MLLLFHVPRCQDNRKKLKSFHALENMTAMIKVKIMLSECYITHIKKHMKKNKDGKLKG